MSFNGQPLRVDTDDRSFTILYASVTGTSIDTSERIARRARRHGWSVKVSSIDEFEPNRLLEEDLIVFVVSTTGQGQTPPQMVPFWSRLLHPALPNDFLEDLNFAVFALGDSSYPKYNWVGKKLHRRLQLLGATPVIDKGEADDQNEWGIESTFPEWLDTLVRRLDQLVPPPRNFQQIPAGHVPPPRVRLLNCPSADLSPKPKWAPDVRWAKIIKNARVTPEDWFQDVREIEVEFASPEDLNCIAGDVLEIKPPNMPSEVEKFLSATKWTDDADKVFEVSPTDSDQPLPSHFERPTRTTLRSLITEELDIAGVPRLSFFEWLAHFSEGDMKEKLELFCSPEGQDELNDYTHRPRRTVNEVMYEFRSARVPVDYVMDLLPPIRPRGFSIAGIDHQRRRVTILVAIVKYKTIMSVPRTGLATSYLAQLKPGSSLTVRVEPGLLRCPPRNVPLIMIGPGTGVAPMRAIIQERVASDARENLLFFGFRSKEADFYFEDEWTKLQERGFLKLVSAASRDSPEEAADEAWREELGLSKVYVQHKIRQHSDLVRDYMDRGACLYICGTSKNMPKQVKKAVLSALGRHEEGSESDACWDALEKEGRVVEETW